MENVYCVILAGGSGTRFWPKSRHLNPKQLCNIGDSQESMIELTLKRLDGFIPPERRIVVTHAEQYKKTKHIVENLCHHVIPEPQAKNTAAALFLAGLKVKALSANFEDATMISLHADHVIPDVESFRSYLITGVEVAKTGKLTLLGITPTRPDTGFGYIEISDKESNGAYSVNGFHEKPDTQTALKYLENNRHLWNAGMFIWKAKDYFEECQKYISKTFEHLCNLQVPSSPDSESFSELATAYEKIDKISVDHGILEKSDRLAAVKATIDWADVGNWSAIIETFGPNKGTNFISGDVLSIDSEDCLIETDSMFVGTIGLKDIVLVVNNGAVLACHKDRTQDVKKIVEWLKDNGREQLI